MSSITLGGKSYSIKDEIPVAGVPALDFTFVKADLSESTLYDDYEGKVKVLIGIPSLGTSACQAESRRFNEELGKREGVVGIIVSMDLPFAQKNFCEAEGIENVITGSDYRYKDFINEYNTEILSGPFKGLSARSVFVIDQKDTIQYSELVTEVGDQPDYDAVMAAVDKLL